VREALAAAGVDQGKYCGDDGVSEGYRRQHYQDFG
jgi:hypothetical protein